MDVCFLVFQEEHTRLQVANRTLQMDFKSETDAANREIHELKLTLTELKSQQENERSYLNDNLAKVYNVKAGPAEIHVNETEHLYHPNLKKMSGLADFSSIHLYFLHVG